jgi:hypothetical protein
MSGFTEDATPSNKDGCSWTPDRRLAEWFARRFGDEGRPALILSATVERDSITVLKLDRGEEQEVILFDPPGDEEIDEESLDVAAQHLGYSLPTSNSDVAIQEIPSRKRP